MVSKNQFVALSEFRVRLAQFLRFSAQAAHDAGITPMQYLLLLHLRGGLAREWATVGEIATRLQASHQGTVALVQRCVRNGLVEKRRSSADARYVEIHLTPRARKLVERIASRHVSELQRIGEVFGVIRATRPVGHRAAATINRTRKRSSTHA